MTIKEIDAAIEEGESLKQIAQAYSEIANIKIKKIRADVERNRVFFQEISKVYALIKQLALQRKISIAKHKQIASIVLTSNYRFYGSINSDLLEFFTAAAQKINSDHIYLGKAAIEYFRAQPISANRKEVLLKGDQPDANELLMLTNLLSDYNQVLVFYSSMKSLLIQVPTVLDITASAILQEKTSAGLLRGNEKQIKFIFEPELPKILHFFDSQIITLLLEGTFLESELSRTASRFISMDQAETASIKFIKEYQAKRAYAERNMDNNTILENFAAMMALRKDIYA